jgi:KRAB domain-containing zinc finger protein
MREDTTTPDVTNALPVILCSLAKAISAIHAQHKNFVCVKCGESFAGKRDLKRHEKRERLEKDFVCDICQASFQDGSKLKDHMGIHTGNKRHFCRTCGKAFRFSSGLSRHRKTHEKK